MVVQATAEERRGAARRDPRRGAGRVRRARAPRRVDRGDREAAPASRSRTCSGSSAPRRTCSRRPSPAASARRSRCSSGRPRASAARRRSRRWARRTEQLLADRTRLRAQMQAYAACDDPEIREVVRNGFGDIVAYVERVSGLPDGGGHALLRHRDADERHRLDGSVRSSRRRGRSACSPAARKRP